MSDIDTKVQPALTSEQWKEWQRGERYVLGFPQNAMLNRPGIERQEPGLRHAIAATALYGQPFGFTQEDVAALRESAEDDHAAYEHHATLRSIADRLAALLPVG